MKKDFISRICFLSFIFIMMFIYYSNIIKKMTHPRNHFLLIISCILLLVFFIIDFKFVKNKIKFSFIYVIPLILFLFLNNGDLSIRTIKNKGINIGNKTEKKVEIKTKEVDEYNNLKNEYIELNDTNYLYYANSISEYTFDFIGSKIKLTGYIYRDDTIKNNQFIIGRLGLTCCSTDASLVGFLATYEDYKNIITNEWYEIIGYINETYYKEVTVPYIEVVEIKKISKPNVEYVY